ncbi:MAG: TerB family tellurite resistance protein [Pseudomonadota bacterium]
MIAKLKQFFQTNLSAIEEKDENHQLQLATSALFIEMMLQDGEEQLEEKQAVRKAIKSCLNINDKQIDELFVIAEEELKQSTDYFQFTQLINKNYNPQQKIKIIENLWTIAYSDSQLDDLEEHMVRRISELIYVPHTQFIKAKLKVIEQMDNSANG